MTQGAATMEENEEARWLRFHQCLRELLPNALRREGRKLAPVRDRPQEGHLTRTLGDELLPAIPDIHARLGDGRAP